MKANDTPKITVAVRKRPLNRKELQRQEADIVKVGSHGQVIISQMKQKVDLTKYLEETKFNFDFAYDQHSKNQQIYQQSVRPLIENAFKGAKISCFAYGQTGSGKTYTMKGDIRQGVPGIYYLGAKEIFRFLEQPQHRSLQINVTFFQIYCGKLYDLLNNRNVLQIREDKKGNINVIGLNQKQIYSAEEFMDIIESGSVLRVTSQNNTNDDSSRSHAILQICLKQKKNVFSKISFIDLAGNERGADHMDMNKQTKIDGAQINKSLLTLKECIRALDQGKSHTPFRGSKLTMVLKDSFVGYCNTVMICNVSPNSSSSENTMNTLRYADRVKQLKRSGQGERLSKEEMLSRELMLPRGHNKNSVKVNIERGDNEEDIMNKMDMARAIQENHPYKIEQKMDIEEPKSNIPLQFGRKTDNEPRLFNEKRISKETGGRRVTQSNSEANMFRGRQMESDKQPLLSRNVPNQKIDQNNINCGNGIGVDPKNRALNFNLNRSHYQTMRDLREQFVNYRSDHEIYINREMNLLRRQIAVKEDYRSTQGNGNYQGQIYDINSYITEMERIMKEKEEIFTIMKNQLQRVKESARNAENMTSNFRQEHEPRQLFSQQVPMPVKNQTRILSNNINFNHQQNYGGYGGDEQLLEGLGEEPRLF